MKKWIRNTLIGLGVVITGGYFGGMPLLENTVVDMSLDFEPHTLEMVFNDTNLIKEHYYIEGKKSPADYGFENYEEIEYTSVYDTAIQLTGWMVHSAVSDTAPCVILSHGRTSNRLKPMKFLELFQSMGLDSAYNFFIPDFRNSGNSSPARTAFGNKFAEDLTATCLMLNDRFQAKDLTLYSFSMGATASSIMLWREDLNTKLTAQNITIHKMIFDSALSNIKGVLDKRGQEMSLPSSILKGAYEKLSQEIIDNEGNSVFDKMYFSELLKNVEIPTLFLHNEADSPTPFELLQKELKTLNKPNFKLVSFKNEVKAEEVHVRMVIHYRERYEKAVKDFLVL
ncbi:MAG: hypothetical protein ACPG19_01095 [Saprospiraceae bacterium]